ncbi:MAG: tetratricopeptide repeat-containing sulfotransferase family protein [Gammaproteobacteria bacterium]
MLSLILAAQGRTEEGLGCIEHAIRLEPRLPALHATRGRILFLASRYEAAIAALEQALASDPANPEALHCLALCLQRLGRLQGAEAVARKALAVQPAAPDVLDNLGVILLQRGDPEAARTCFERALVHADSHPGALANLALLHEQNNRLDEAERLARKGLANNPQAVTLRLVLGRCLRRRSEFAAARQVFESLGETDVPALRKDVAYELGLCADAEGDTDAAFMHTNHANVLVRSMYPQAEQEARGFSELIARLQQRFTPEWVAAWQGLSESGEESSPAFLIGFPRSGTTLLDTMLGAHPEVTVLEEQASVQSMLACLTAQVGSYPDALATLTPADQSVIKHAYRDAIVKPAGYGKQLLDKSPFNTVHVGLITRIFPDAPILFATRHPCDVVLSCFMTNFALNSGTAHFTALGSTVRLYCSVMSLWQTYTQILQLNYRLVRYEDLIADPEAELREIISFLGLPWSPAVLDHMTHAATRKDVRTASYAQIGHELYSDARNRWRRYRKHLEPYLETLQPFCKLFGYDI